MRYKIFLSSVQVLLFADRLEIRNPGQLPSSLTIKTLKKDHSSYPKNPLIAESLYFAKYVERMGPGIQDMILEYGLPEPEFKITDAFVVTIRRKKGIAFEKVEGQIISNVIENVIENVTENVTEKRVSLLINLIKKNNKITIGEMAAILGVTKRTIIRDINSLKENGCITRIGPDKGGHWLINEDGLVNLSK